MSSSSSATPGCGPPSAVPPPWIASLDPNSGLYYYYNQETKVSQWEYPAIGQREVSGGPPPKAKVKLDFSEAIQNSSVFKKQGTRTVQTSKVLGTSLKRKAEVKDPEKKPRATLGSVLENYSSSSDEEDEAETAGAVGAHQQGEGIVGMSCYSSEGESEGVEETEHQEIDEGTAEEVYPGLESPEEGEGVTETVSSLIFLGFTEDPKRTVFPALLHILKGLNSEISNMKCQNLFRVARWIVKGRVKEWEEGLLDHFEIFEELKYLRAKLVFLPLYLERHSGTSGVCPELFLLERRKRKQNGKPMKSISPFSSLKNVLFNSIEKGEFKSLQAMFSEESLRDKLANLSYISWSPFCLAACSGKRLIMSFLVDQGGTPKNTSLFRRICEKICQDPSQEQLLGVALDILGRRLSPSEIAELLQAKSCPPLELVCRRGEAMGDDVCSRILQLLVAHEVNPNCFLPLPRSFPLQIFIELSFEKSVRVLLEGGANPRLRLQEGGETILEAARRNRRGKVLMRLLEKYSRR